MSEYGKLASGGARRLACPPARHQQQRVTDLLDTLEQVNGRSRSRPALDARPHLRHLAGQHRARESAGHHARRPRHRDAGGRAHASAPDRRQRHRVRPWHRRDHRLALQSVRDAGMGRQRSRRRRQQGARPDADSRGGTDRAHTLERVPVLPGEDARLPRGRQAGGSGRARPRLHDRAGGRDQAHQAENDDGRRARGVRRPQPELRVTAPSRRHPFESCTASSLP